MIHSRVCPTSCMTARATDIVDDCFTITARNENIHGTLCSWAAPRWRQEGCHKVYEHHPHKNYNMSTFTKNARVEGRCSFPLRSLRAQCSCKGNCNFESQTLFSDQSEESDCKKSKHFSHRLRMTPWATTARKSSAPSSTPKKKSQSVETASW